MNSRQRLLDAPSDADMPYAGAPDIEARLERLKGRLWADEEALFAPAEIALRVLRGQPATEAHGACWFFICRRYFYELEYEAAERCAAQAVAIARHANDPELLAKALKILGGTLCEMGKPADAVPVLLEALESARSANECNQASGILTNLGIAQLYGARCGIAHECFEQAWQILPENAPTISRACTLVNQGQVLLRVREIQRGLEVAQAAQAFVANPQTREQAVMRVEVELLFAQLRVAIGDIRQATEHASWTLEFAPRAGEVGRRQARLISLLLDAHDTGRSKGAIDALFVEVKRNKRRFSLYRISLDIAVAALQGAGRPHEALQFLREAAQLDMSLHIGITSHKLPMGIGGKPFELDNLADARAREQRSSLLTQAAHLGAVSDERIEHLVGLAIRAELREEDTFSNGEHAYRLARLSELLALEADCSAEEIANARLAGLLHDVGKVFAPDQLLLKREALTEGEKALLRKHAEDGAGLIENLKNNALLVVADAVRRSHERWDGGGYPAGMQGEAIPIAARIVAICDSFDAMTHWRPFRSPRSFASALSEIEAGSGSRYDPRLSRLFVTLLRRLQRETDDLDRYLAEGAENSPVVQEQRRLAKLLRPQRETL
jgi:putative two-component system response regulator